MRLIGIIAVSSVILGAALSPALADDSGRIYGKLRTVDGDVYEGYIRWDKNEGSWVDILNGSKELPKSHRDYHTEKKRIKIFGIPVGYKSKMITHYGSAQSGICFGHIKTLEVIDDETVLLTLKSGEEVEFENYSTDIGESIRELIIEDVDEGEIELAWGDIDRIDFMQSPSGFESDYGDRLYGTLTTRDGDEFTGWVCWDVDELFTSDVLDGEHKDRKRKIKFGKIKSIERRSSSSARVTLANGDEIVLKGTNDVNDSNRGIIIADAELGQVVVKWDEFDMIEFTEPPIPWLYDDFDGGQQLEGSVFTTDGEEYYGKIRWDNDEEYTWEYLDGDLDDVEFDVEFSHIMEIRRKGQHSVVVTLWDGRSFRLRGSNDVNEDNKGIFVEMSDGDEVEIYWEDFDHVAFKRY
jgi:hypothetical protein